MAYSLFYCCLLCFFNIIEPAISKKEIVAARVDGVEVDTLVGEYVYELTGVDRFLHELQESTLRALSPQIAVIGICRQRHYVRNLDFMFKA